MLLDTAMGDGALLYRSFNNKGHGCSWSRGNCYNTNSSLYALARLSRR